MENNVIETNKNKNLIIGVMACVIVLLIAALVYFVFIKKDKDEEPTKPQDSGQVVNDNNENEINDIAIGYPKNVSLANLTRKNVEPTKKINYPYNETKKVLIDEKLSIMFKENEFSLLYNNKEIKTDKVGFNNSFSGISNEDNVTFDVYMIGDGYLIKSDFFGTMHLNLILFLNSDGDLKYLLDSDEENTLPDLGTLSKVELYSGPNTKPFYLITIDLASESPDHPDDLGTKTYYLYQK